MSTMENVLPQKEECKNPIDDTNLQKDTETNLNNKQENKIPLNVTVESNVVVKQENTNEEHLKENITNSISAKNELNIKTAIKEEKPDVPLKSSMEILSELFSTFDAEPPIIVKKEKSEHKKHKKDKKKHKHKKKKEKKRKKQNSDDDEETLTKVTIKSEISSPKRIKLENDVKQEPGEEKGENSATDTEATIREIKEKQENDEQTKRRSDSDEESTKRHKKKHHKHHRSQDKRERHRRSRSRSSDRKSDEEYERWYRSREKEYHRSRSRDNEKDHHKYRIEKHSRKSSNERHSESFRHRSLDKERDKHRHRDSSESRDSSSGHIDKKKLLEIARRNAIQMMKSGSLPGALTLGPQAQEKVIAAIKAGGKTVEELTDFCKTLSQKEALGDLSSVSEDNSDSENEKAFHHPFQIKDRPTSITMNIKNAIPLPTKTTQERTAELRMQFPVSSGQQHRKTETEWVAVPQKKPESKQTSAFTPKATNVEPKPQEVMPTAAATLPGPQVFPKQTTVDASIDVGAIVSQRLSAIRKLQENPNDSQAITEMYRAQKEMQSWAQSKQQPGQFTGSTGAQIMSQAELSSGYQAWARKDQLQTAAPVSGGMGMHLLQKMGWKPGEGLGKEKSGALEPLLLEVKLDKKGLVANEEQKKKQIKHKQKPVMSLEGKHPVSLLGEYASKRKIGAPQYELCFECGPDHKKNFLFKVILNGMEYKPNVASPNKKEAKANAAAVCLQHLGLLPPPPMNPTPQ